jgi:hypothetical protein
MAAMPCTHDTVNIDSAVELALRAAYAVDAVRPPLTEEEQSFTDSVRGRAYISYDTGRLLALIDKLVGRREPT